MIRNPFKKKIKSPDVVQAAKVISLVNELIRNKCLTIDGPIMKIYTPFLVGKKKVIIKNLFFYARLKDIVAEGETIYLKCLEHDTLITVHNTEKGTVLIK